MLRNTYENKDWKEYENLAGKNIKTFAFGGEKELSFSYIMLYILKNIQYKITLHWKKMNVFLARWRMFQFVQKISVLRYMNKIYKIDFWCVKFLERRKIDYKLKL